jgi:hypothetical protein
MSLPGPPPDLARADLKFETVEPSRLLRLAYRAVRTHVRFRRDAQYRFDAPAGEFGVLYAAFDLATAFAESVLRTKPQDAATGEPPLLTYEELARRRVITLAGVRGAAPLRLVKLHDDGLVAARVDNRIATEDDYRVTQQWARAFHDHPAAPDGLLYQSRFLGSRQSVALFDRCEDRLRRARVVPLLRHADLPDVLERFELAVRRPRRSYAVGAGRGALNDPGSIRGLG